MIHSLPSQPDDRERRIMGLDPKGSWKRNKERNIFVHRPCSVREMISSWISGLNKTK